MANVCLENRNILWNCLENRIFLVEFPQKIEIFRKFAWEKIEFFGPGSTTPRDLKPDWRPWSNELHVRQRPRRDSRNKSSNMIIELRLSDHNYYDIMMERQKCAVVEFRKSNVFNNSWKLVLKLFIVNLWFPTFGRGTLLLLLLHTSTALVAHRLGSIALGLIL